jgi:hypothetical protein
MAKVVAALILRTDDEARPTKDALEAAAKRVRDYGIQVDRVGRRHLTVKGERSTLAQALGVLPVRDGHVDVIAEDAPLADLFSAIEITEAPEFFGR